MNVQALGAHPDDLDFYCGGTPIHFVQEGNNVVVCIVTDGRGNPAGGPQAAALLFIPPFGLQKRIHLPNHGLTNSKSQKKVNVYE